MAKKIELCFMFHHIYSGVFCCIIFFLIIYVLKPFFVYQTQQWKCLAFFLKHILLIVFKTFVASS